MVAFLSLASCPLPSSPSLAVAGLEAAGIAAYVAVVVLVLRVAIGWAERALRAEAPAASDPAAHPEGPSPRG